MARLFCLFMLLLAAGVATSSKQCSLKVDTDVEGGDFMNVAATSEDRCCTACAAQQGCFVAVLFQGKCYLKSSSATVQKHSVGRVAVYPESLPPSPPPTPAQAQVSITTDLSVAATPFPHIWENSTGSGHFALALRSDYQAHMKRCQRELGFKRVRMHGMLQPGMNISTASGVNNYDKLDAVIDFLDGIGMDPLFEIGFMPEWLASSGATWFHYKGNISPPKNHTQWGEVMEDLANHLLHKYGKEHVERWFFEVWNEPDLHMWTGSPKMDTYFKLYQTTAQAFHRVSDQFQLGGPATSSGQWLPEFLDFCERTNTPVSFVSSHLYAGGPCPNCFNVENLASGFAAMKSRIAGRKPFFVTEWGGTWSHDAALDESSYAPFIIAAIVANYRNADVFSFWTFSDIFEEQAPVPTSYSYTAQFGLLNNFGIPKPSFRAVQLLHWAGEQRLPVLQSATDAACKRSVSAVTLLNTTHVTMLVTNQMPLSESTSDCTIALEMKPGWPASSAATTRIDAKHANAKAWWQQMGSPPQPTQQQMSELEKASNLEVTHVDLHGPLLTSVPAQGVFALFVHRGGHVYV